MPGATTFLGHVIASLDQTQNEEIQDLHELSDVAKPTILEYGKLPGHLLSPSVFCFETTHRIE